MSSPIIGRTRCPECGFESAHVKQSPKCLYRYCPECGSQHHARSDRQRADLKEKTRLIEQAAPTHTDATATPTPTEVIEEVPTHTHTDAAAEATATQPKRRGLFT